MTWNSAAHPRNPKGAGGGEFKSGQGGAAAKPTGGGPGAPARRAGGARRAGSLRFNGRTGTGYGSAHGDPRVRRLQEAMNRLHMTDAHGRPLRVDGKLGPKTTAAIKNWQRRNGFTADGVVTAAMLKQATAPAHKRTHLTRRRPLKAPKRAAATGRARPKGGLSLDTQTAINQSIARGR